MRFSTWCYPETVHRIYIVNAPSVFQVVWRFVKQWVDPQTATKIQVLGKDYHARFRELLPGVELPDLYDC